MHIQKIYLALAFNFATVLASIIHEQAVTNPEITARGGHQVSGAITVKQARHKYGARPRSYIADRSVSNTTVTATPDDSYGSAYLVVVGVGSPEIKYSMSVDTGDADVTVYSPQVRNSTNVITSVDVGGLVVKKQLVNMEPGSFSENESILGLAPTGGSFYANLVTQGTINAVFTVHLNRAANGTIGFGFINPAAYTGSIAYVTGDSSNGFWEFHPTGYAIGGGAFVRDTLDAIVDTGTTLTFLSQPIVDAYYKQVSGAVNNQADGGYVFPCSAKLPNLVIGITSTYNATVPGSYLNYAPVTDGSSTCFGGLQSDSGIGFSILGLNFITSQFIVFKGTTSTSLGFANKA